MIRRVLVADRGDAARRVCATCRVVGIETVAVYSDADASGPHVVEADWAVHLPGNAPTATYQRGDLLIAAARRAGADAVHPGWGPLAADADFAAAVADSGLTWIGPPAKTLALLGDRWAVAAQLAEAGVAVLPPERVAVEQRDSARRLDVQVIVDSHGNTVVFGEREVSVQRRQRPLLAETPSPVVPPELREELTRTALAAVTALGYTGVATVELLLAADGNSYVTHLDPLLPAEHAATECASGLDLVRLQLLVAEGAPLPFTGAPPLRGHTIAVALRAEDPAYAWQPTAGPLHRFQLGPVKGEFRPLPAPGLRLDAATAGGGEISGRYDSTMATLTAWAPTRYEAARLLAGALARAHLHGLVTNRDLLVRVLRHPAFLAGAVDTGFLDTHPEVFAPLLSSVDGVRLSCLAAALAAASARRAAAPVLGGLASGWRNVPSGAQTAVYMGPMGTVEIGYRLDRAGELESWWVRAVDPEELDLAGLGQPSSLPDDHPPVALLSVTAEQVVLDVTGVRLTFSVHRVDEMSYVDSTEGSVVLAELPRHPVPAAIDDD
jgi:propionyl-CoA carboxylase alpha chain